MDSPFNLPNPPGFRGFDPNRGLRIYRRHLPHWRQSGATYFVTFNLADAIPANKQSELASLRREWKHTQMPSATEADWLDFAKRHFSMSERILDAGYGKCFFRNDEYAEELCRALLHFHEERYELGCFVIMANHCHLTMRPFDDYTLEHNLRDIKSVVARYVNRRERHAGPIWQQESYDRIIRDEEHLYRVVQYIGANPRKARVDPANWHRWLNPEWARLGWRFEEEA